jgi:hypothetical protein
MLLLLQDHHRLIISRGELVLLDPTLGLCTSNISINPQLQKDHNHKHIGASALSVACNAKILGSIVQIVKTSKVCLMEQINSQMGSTMMQEHHKTTEVSKLRVMTLSRSSFVLCNSRGAS